MIHVSWEGRKTIKQFLDFPDEVIGFHPQFGLVRESKAQEREVLRKRRGLKVKNRSWQFQFRGENVNGQMKIKPISGCEVIKATPQESVLKTTFGELVITYKTVPPMATTIDGGTKEERDYFAVIFGTVLLIFLSLFLFMKASEKEEEKEEKEPLTVEVVTLPTKTVKIPANIKKVQRKKLTKTEKAHRAVKQNFGFLGLLGKKTLTKAVGGAETKLKKATAGAGQGGDAGSGGEYLAGVGAGVKKITVGNSGVKGLGGIGTKGKGGGKGGYGTAQVASGEGSGLSTLAVSDDMILSGGLDRYVIKATIAKYLNQVRACYEEGLAKNPKLQGEVRVVFEIGGAGRLNYSRVGRSSLGNAKVEKCITRKMMTWLFPKPRGGVDVKVKYPFMLRPVNS